MKPALHLLIVEDSEFDGQMMVSMLRRAGYDVTWERVETAATMRTALKDKRWDCILADYNLPEFSATAALALLHESGLDIPFIIVSGGIGEDIAVAAMKAGVHDYLMKGNLNRLAPAVERELREAANRASQRDAKQALLDSETRNRLLWETCPDAVILMDLEGCIRFANPAVAEVFGHSAEDIIGQSFSCLLPERLRADHLAAIDGYLRSGAAAIHWRARETLGLRRDGVELPIEISFADMKLPAARLFVAFIRDITERKRAEKELREHAEQLAAAREIQQRLFPKAAPAIPGFEIAGASYPAEETGGDYFDYLPMLNQRVGIIAADVTGHGIGAALIMVETRAYLRVLAGRREDPGEILERANGILHEDLGDEQYVTLFLGRIDPATRTLAYASAGHPAGYLMGADGEIKWTLRCTGAPLGLQPVTRISTSKEIPLTEGDILVLLTDGIEETLSADEKEIFGSQRILELVRRYREKSARVIVDVLYQAARQFAHHAPQTDDATAIVIRVLPVPGEKP